MNKLHPKSLNRRKTIPLRPGSAEPEPALFSKTQTPGRSPTVRLRASTPAVSQSVSKESTLHIAHEGVEVRGVPAWKRALDITCMLLSMAIWLPLMGLVMLWIKAVSSGPVFFRQERVGFRGKRFIILKFRSMKVNVETQTHERYLEQLIQANCAMTKLDASGDPRLIPGGRLLRATGLDELPQLFNVLSGDMSLVGPRPCTPHEFAHYQVWQKERVNAAPGLTGSWQVNGKNKTTFSEMIQMDIAYTKNMSLLGDIMIMLKTIPAIFGQVLEPMLARWKASVRRPESVRHSIVQKCKP